MKKTPILGKHPQVSLAVLSVLVIGFLLFLPYALPSLFGNTSDFSGDVQITADQQYFAPQISSAKGLRLDITNLSGREIMSTRQVWSADYGFFVRVEPSTSEVTILGNPAEEKASRHIYWTFSENDPGRTNQPVAIHLQVYRLKGNEELAHSSIYLTWYNNDIVFVNKSFEPEKR